MDSLHFQLKGALLLCLAGILAAGRPVFHEISLESVIGRSQIILIASKRDPFRSQDGCTTHLHFSVEKVLYSAPDGRSEKPGNSIDVSNEGLASHFDCEERKSNPSGVSFAATRYRPIDGFQSWHQLERAILFLSSTDQPGQYQFVVDGAFEKVEKEREIVTTISSLPNSGIPPKRAFED